MLCVFSCGVRGKEGLLIYEKQSSGGSVVGAINEKQKGEFFTLLPER